MAEPEVVARRKTYDDKTVLFWSDGALTSAMNWYVRGGKIQTDRMLWAVADEVTLYDWSEIPVVLRVAKKVEKRRSWSLPELRREIGRALDEA